MLKCLQQQIVASQPHRHQPDQQRTSINDRKIPAPSTSVHHHHAISNDVAVAAYNRRELLATATAVISAGCSEAAARPAAAFDVPWQGLGTEGPAAGASRRIRPELASAFTKSVYDALLQTVGMSQQELQQEIYRLRNREYPYYSSSYTAAQLPSVPDLSDSSGGLSNPVYFNFISYIEWKIAAGYVKDAEQRKSLNQLAGRLLADKVAKDYVELASRSAAANGGRATPQEVQAAVTGTLQMLREGGYVDDFRVAWGGTPNLPERPYGEPVASGGAAAVPDSADINVFQVTLRGPADILSSVSLRGEEGGWWGRAASSLLAAVLSAGGYPDATADEFFFQDEWRGPKSLADRALLLFGDPLQQVEVPWVPTSLVQDWRLS